MSIDALVSGRLHGAPKSRTAKSGLRYATGVVRASFRDGNAMFVNVIAFAEAAVAALLALSDGDSVALSGELTPKVYVPSQGDPRPSADLLAHAVLTEYQVVRKRKAVQAAGVAASGALPFDDALPPMIGVRRG
jgi:single-stranded DNA-binding protein